jgi:hypothetical protein
MTKAIIIKCIPDRQFVGHVVEAHPSKITLTVNGKVHQLFETVPVKMNGAGHRILFHKDHLSFLPPEDDINQYDEVITVKVADIKAGDPTVLLNWNQ